jgi:hypothetical protein
MHCAPKIIEEKKWHACFYVLHVSEMLYWQTCSNSLSKEHPKQMFFFFELDAETGIFSAHLSKRFLDLCNIFP